MNGERIVTMRRYFVYANAVRLAAFLRTNQD